ncbi:MAG: nucleotidyltransferase family protein [Pseudomonadota bacterium]
MSFAALILAGSRPGAPDPVAAAEGVAHKALAPVGGRTLLARVAGALTGAARIAVSANDPAVIAEAGRLSLTVLPPAPGPSASVALALADLGAPLVVTTADHALLRAEWVAALVAGTPPGTDVAVMLAERARVEADAPASKRTWLKFADGQWSGCNLFYLATPQAARAIELWKLVEADRKRPWRIVARLGPGLLLRYVFGRLTLADAVATLGRKAGVAAAVVPAPHGLAAVDVDSVADLALVRRLVEEC